jgi:preprotein translocase subunit YajC
MMILADAAAPAGKTPPGWYQFFATPTFPLMIVVTVVWIYFLRNKRGPDKQLADRLKDLKRGDRIQTIGGILGTVVEARESDVVVKVDESNNTKIKFSRKAISAVIDDEKTTVK